MSTSRVAIAALLLSTAGTFHDASAIIGGTASSEWPAVGAYWNTHAMMLCSAFAISPRWILTAGLCTLGSNANDTFTIGDDPFAAGAPSYDLDTYIVDPAFNSSFSNYDHNVALVHVKSQDLPYLPLKLSAQTMSAADVGRSVDMLGYGATSFSTVDFLKRFGQTTISAFNFSTIDAGYSPAGMCAGDNGLPMYVDQNGFPVAIGIGIVPSNLQCDTYDIWQRIDLELTFIAVHVSDACIAGNPCGGIFRDTFDVD